MSKKIDIVIPWVDGADPVWLAEKKKYEAGISSDKDSSAKRYRDMDNLQYVFRGIEKHMPWVNSIYFLTCGHIPQWLNTGNARLRIVNHKEFIPEEFLPTFSSHVIELNMHRIEGLSEHFIYFNDDIFVLKDTKETDFFKDGLPCDSNIPAIVVPTLTRFPMIVFNTVAYINKNFDKRKFIKEHPDKWFNLKFGIINVFKSLIFSQGPSYIGFKNIHVANAYNKSILNEVWKAEPEILLSTCSHRFRSDNDVNQYLFRYWQLASGKFSPARVRGRSFRLTDNNKELLDYLRRRKNIMVCINDTDMITDFDKVKKDINKALQSILPDKSSFEL